VLLSSLLKLIWSLTASAGNYHDGTILDQGCTGLCEYNHRVRDGYMTVYAGYDYQFANRFVRQPTRARH
jgi:hypothetical protein